MSRRIVLGINAAHDAAACLLRDGELMVAVPEERLSRVKHHRGFPHRSIAYCLRRAGCLSLDDIAAIVLNESVNTDFGLMLEREWGFSGDLTVNPSHHLLHAQYAVTASGLPQPAVLVLDGSGYSYGEYERQGSPLLGPAPPYSEMEESESTYRVGPDGEINLVDKRWGLWRASEPFTRFPSLGHLFSAASEYIFGGMDHAGKTMGLAAYGDASSFPGPIIEYGPDGLTIDTEWITRVPPRSSRPAHLDPVCRDIAAKVQAELERAVIFLCRRVHDATGAEALCLSGGVGLNSVANGRILRETRFRRLFVTPASGDSGIAIGAALYGHRRLVGKHATWAMYDNFHGECYSDATIEAAIDARRGLIRSERLIDVALAAARDVAEGRCVGWFEGPSEFGPRALGHRSIVCDPRLEDMRERLNAEVKFREPFRPYAASVLTEHAREYFDLIDQDPFMMTIARLVEGRPALISSVCHIDGTCRIQTVDPGYPGNYRRLIECFRQLTGVPLVLNTSFNIRGEPIVETPDDALRCFLGCNLDVLYLSDHRITKIAVPSGVAFEDVVPCLNEAVSIGSRIDSHGGAAGETEYFCRTRTGYSAPITQDEYGLLQRIDARRTVGELRQLLPAGASACDVIEAVHALQRRGFLSLREASARSNK